ncbi:ribonuclease HII [Bradyrhizobium diazoefficiens]
MRKQGRLRTIPAMIRDKSAKRPAKDAPKKAAVKEAAPVKASFRRERALIKRGIWPVAGCDEAGRGPLAGPVVAAAVILDPDRIPRGIDDSKRLTAEQREKLFDKICATAQVSVAVASPARIDRDNILRASLWALKRAVVALPEAPRHVFVDGRDRLDTACDCEAVIGGDGIVLSIAAASIVAKVTRDRLMCALAQDCPGYGFEQHKGYGVPAASRRAEPPRPDRPPPQLLRPRRRRPRQAHALDSRAGARLVRGDRGRGAAGSKR